MSNRRKFLKHSAIGAIGAILLPELYKGLTRKSNPNTKKGFPMVISTWEHGLPANEAAMKILHGGGKAIDAVEAGVRIPEADPDCMLMLTFD